MRDEDVNKFHFKKILSHIFIDHQLTKNTTSVLQLPEGKQDFFSFLKRGEVISLSQTKTLQNSKGKFKKKLPILILISPYNPHLSPYAKGAPAVHSHLHLYLR